MNNIVLDFLQKSSTLLLITIQEIVAHEPEPKSHLFQMEHPIFTNFKTEQAVVWFSVRCVFIMKIIGKSKMKITVAHTNNHLLLL
jgi:hypothetical protein